MSEAEKIAAIGLETAAPLISESNVAIDNRNLGGRSGNRHQDVRFEQRGICKDHQTNNYSNGAGRSKATQWNPPAPNTESHWDDLTTVYSTSGTNSKGRNENGKVSKVSDSTIQSNTNMPVMDLINIFSTESNIYEGTRREFVNSKNRIPSGIARSGKNLRGGSQQQRQFVAGNRPTEKYVNNLENSESINDIVNNSKTQVINKTSLVNASGNERSPTETEISEVSLI